MKVSPAISLRENPERLDQFGVGVLVAKIVLDRWRNKSEYFTCLARASCTPESLRRPAGTNTMASPSPLLAEAKFPERNSSRFLNALHRYWGYESFRPGQENIVTSIAAGRDACVVMPTGGGKSLCYQLPAVLDAKRTAIVISPLIALMQDQVAQLEQIGVPAAFVNSSLAGEERSRTLKRAEGGEFRLLYFSPERVALGHTPEWLRRIPVSFFAIDEAHCISEW